MSRGQVCQLWSQLQNWKQHHLCVHFATALYCFCCQHHLPSLPGGVTPTWVSSNRPTNFGLSRVPWSSPRPSSSTLAASIQVLSCLPKGPSRRHPILCPRYQPTNLGPLGDPEAVLWFNFNPSELWSGDNPACSGNLQETCPFVSPEGLQTTAPPPEPKVIHWLDFCLSQTQISSNPTLPRDPHSDPVRAYPEARWSHIHYHT